MVVLYWCVLCWSKEWIFSFITLQVIPPGMEFHHIAPQDGDMDFETEGNEDHPASPDPPIWTEVLIFLYLSIQVICHRRFSLLYL